MKFSRYIRAASIVCITTYNHVTLLGLSGLEPPTSRLSGVRSNHLSYKPIWIWPFLPAHHLIVDNL